MPEETIVAFQDHGEVAGDTVTKDVAKAHALLDELAAVGVDYDDVVLTLEQEGVEKFAASFAELLEGVRAKREAVAA
jgi:transaldolase